MKTTCNSYKKQVIKHKLYIKTIFMFVFRASKKNNKKLVYINFIDLYNIYSIYNQIFSVYITIFLIQYSKYTKYNTYD